MQSSSIPIKEREANAALLLTAPRLLQVLKDTRNYCKVMKIDVTLIDDVINSAEGKAND